MDTSAEGELLSARVAFRHNTPGTIANANPGNVLQNKGDESTTQYSARGDSNKDPIAQSAPKKNNNRANKKALPEAVLHCIDCTTGGAGDCAIY